MPVKATPLARDLYKPVLPKLLKWYGEKGRMLPDDALTEHVAMEFGDTLLDEVCKKLDPPLQYGACVEVAVELMKEASLTAHRADSDRPGDTLLGL